MAVSLTTARAPDPIDRSSTTRASIDWAGVGVYWRGGLNDWVGWVGRCDRYMHMVLRWGGVMWLCVYVAGRPPPIRSIDRSTTLHASIDWAGVCVCVGVANLITHIIQQPPPTD